jgi:outer membrane protein OmpA-like peptidoglycan-associated protein
MNEQPGSTWSDAVNNSDDSDDEAPVVVVRRPKADVATAPVVPVVPVAPLAPVMHRMADVVGDVVGDGVGDVVVGAPREVASAVLTEPLSTTTKVVDAGLTPLDESSANMVAKPVNQDSSESDSENDETDPIIGRKVRLDDDDRRQRNNAFRLMGASLAVLLVLAVLVRRSSIESTLESRINAVLAFSSADKANVQVKVVGRDVTLSGNVIDESKRQEIIAQVRDRHGVRQVNASKLKIGMPLSAPGAEVPTSTNGNTAESIPGSDAPGDAGTTVAATANPTEVATTLAPRLRPTVVAARIAGSVLTVKATVSDANVKDILLKRASDNLTADELVSEVTIDSNDGQSDEVAHRRVGEFLEYLVKSGFNEASLRYDDGVMILDASVKTAVEGEQLRAEALRLVGDPAKLRPSIAVSALPASTSAAAGETTTTVSVTSTTLSPEALVEQQRLDSAVSGRTIAFDKESDKLSTEGRNIVDEVAGVILAMPDKTLRVEVGGYTDSKGSDGGNKRLSQRRATAVKNRLVLKGVPAARIDAVGFGEANPIADNNTEDGKAQNRRIEFKIVGSAASAAPTPVA